MSYQQILIQGNLTRDAEVRQVGQNQVAKLGVAVSERFRKQDGTVGESVEYFEVEVWDKPNVYPYLTKGAAVLIVGQQKTEKWQDQSGQPRETKKVRAQVVQLVGGRPQQAPATAPTAPPPAPAYAPAPAAAPAPAPAPAYPPQPQYQAPPVPPSYPAPPTPPAGPFDDLPPGF